MSSFLFSYDVTSSKRIRQMEKCLERFEMVRLQKSIYYLEVSPEEQEELITSTEKIIKEDEDHVLMIPICAKDFEKTEWYGKERPKLIFDHKDFMIL